MVNYRRRRSTFGNNKTRPVQSLITAGVSLGTLIVLGVIIAFSASVAGDTSNWIGAIAVLAGLVSICSAFISGKQLKQRDDFITRLVCFVVSILAVAAWAFIYILGVIN